MDHLNEPDSSTRYADLRKALGRSRVENLVAWEEPNGEHLLRPYGEVTGSRKDERSDMILMDYELGPESLALQNHMEILMVFENSTLFDHYFPRRAFP